MYTSKYLSSAAAVDMVSWNTGFWSSLKGVWCCSSQGETKRVTLCPPAGCQVCSAGGKGERLSQFCSCPSTSSHHIVLLWYMGSDFLWSLPLPLIQNILSHLLFLPAVSPLLATTYIIIFAPWMMHLNKKKKKPTHLHNSSCPSLSWAPGHKAAGKKLTALSPASPSPAACSEFSDSNTLNLGDRNAGKVTCMSQMWKQ